jgi:hypothetical protein
VGNLAPLGAVGVSPGSTQDAKKPSGRRPAGGYEDPQKEARYQAWKKANE